MDQKKRKRGFALSFFSLLTLLSSAAYAQTNGYPKDSTTTDVRRNFVGVEIRSSVLPMATIHTREGNYRLYSRLHSSFCAGINYLITTKSLWGIHSGLIFNLTTSNFFGTIPAADFSGTGIVRVEDAPPVIYYKGLYARLSLPMLITRAFPLHKKKFWNVQAGVNFNYSGFSGKERIVMSVGDTNNRQVPVFNSNFCSNNRGKPWLTFHLGSSNNLYLDNGNIISIGLFAELSGTDFLKNDYAITIPNQPVTTGTYTVKGSSVGLRLQYTFTGTNKRFVKEREKSIGYATN